MARHRPGPGRAGVGQPRRGDERGPGGEYVFEWHGRLAGRGGRHHGCRRDADRGDRPRRPAGDRDHDPGGRAAGSAGSSPSAGRRRGRLHAGVDGELRSGGLDVGSAGTILVVGSRVDAETLTRARAMGVCGVVVAGLSSKERRDFIASEARQRAALHRLPPFAVLVLDGATRRPLAGAVQAVLAALAGREVAIVTDPPTLALRPPEPGHPGPAGRPRPHPGGLACPAARAASSRRSDRAGSPGGVQLEAGIVQLPDGTDAAIPLGDLERFV